MPAGRGEGTAPRQNFRPPWVKEGAPAQNTPAQAAPWTLANRKTSDAGATNPDTAPTDLPKAPPGRKTSKVTLVPVQPPQENGSSTANNEDSAGSFIRPKLKPVQGKSPLTKNPSKDTMNKLQSREIKVPIEISRPRKVEIPLERVNRKEPPPPVEKTEPKKPEIPVVQLRKVEKPAIAEPPKKKDEFPFQVKLNETKKLPPPAPKNTDNEEIDAMVPSKRHDLVRQESLKNRNMPPPPPMAPPMPPPAPKLPRPDVELITLTEKGKAKVEQMKQRPRKRPDWAKAMKEIESGLKLKHVVCNDRSKPILSNTKAKGQFVYESEKDNVHNILLKQIQGGVPLKRVKCNDRSKPILDGLRKFRRQLTIEEQIIKSQSIANMAEVSPEVQMEEADEMDDIDKVRDDLQSTKQLLALELRNKEAQIRENKRLLARLQQLEAELEMEKANKTTSTVEVKQDTSADEKFITTLKSEVQEARKTAVELEKKFQDTADQLDFTKSELEEMKKQNQQLQMKLQGQGGKGQDASRKNSTIQGPNAIDSENEFSEEEPLSDDGEDDGSEEKVQKRQQRELKLLGNKLKNYKHKEENAKKERKVLKDIIKKVQQSIKEEKKKYKALQKEVNKMASMMKDMEDEDEDEEKEEKEEEEVEEEESEESESESESESETSEEESSESESEDAPFEKKRENFSNRAKRHENCLGALKKGNYMLKANAERLQDDLNKQREMSVGLQEDLDSVLAELG